MLNQQIISHNIQPADINWTAKEAIDLAAEKNYSFLPIVDGRRCLGILPVAALEQATINEPVSDFSYRIQPFQVRAKDHVFRALAVFSAQPGIDFIPVTDDEGLLAGFLERKDTLRLAASLLGLHDTGPLIVIEMDYRDFAPGELNKLVETNDAQITQLNTMVNDEGKLVASLRVNTPEISDIVATLQRYDYSVLYFEGEEQYQNQLRQNYDLLMNFLEM